MRGRAIDGVAFNLVTDTPGRDLAVSYADRAGVLYRDLLAGKYRAEDVAALPANARSLVALDINYDGAADLVAAGPDAPVVLLGNGRAVHRCGGCGTEDDLRRARGLREPRRSPTSSPAARCCAIAARGVLTGPAARCSRTPRSLVTADFDNDGKVDAAGFAADGTLHFLKNDTATTNTWLRLALTGVKNAEARARGAGRGQERHHLPEEDLRGRAAVVRAAQRDRDRHGAHHLAERADPERADRGGRQARRRSRKRRGSPARAR